jgi:hypothetical protein
VYVCVLLFPASLYLHTASVCVYTLIDIYTNASLAYFFFARCVRSVLPVLSVYRCPFTEHHMLASLIYSASLSLSLSGHTVPGSITRETSSVRNTKKRISSFASIVVGYPMWCFGSWRCREAALCCSSASCVVSCVSLYGERTLERERERERDSVSKRSSE